MGTKYLSLEGLKEYDALVKGKIDEGDLSSLEFAKSYTDRKTKAITEQNIDDAFNDIFGGE